MQRPSVLWTALDADHDGTLSAAEIAAAPKALRTLDKNQDGNLTMDELRPAGRGGEGRGDGGGRGEGGERREGGEGAPVDNTEETVKTLMAFDANGDGKLQKSELPERMQGIFERGDTNHDGVLTVEEIRTMARAQASQQQARNGMGGRGGEGRGVEGRGGEGRGNPAQMMRMMDPIFAALDTNQDGVLTSDEIDNAPKSLLILDKNHDGVITQEEARPAFGQGRGPGRG